MPKQRLDLQLIQRGIAENQEQAQRMIRAGMVRVNEQTADKPGIQYPDDADLFVKQKGKYVSRGGLKIEGAHKQFGFDLDGAICLDGSPRTPRIDSVTGKSVDSCSQSGSTTACLILKNSVSRCFSAPLQRQSRGRIPAPRRARAYITTK